MKAINFISQIFFGIVDDMGRRVVETLSYAYNIFRMTYLSLRSPFIDQAQGIRQIFSVISMQIYFTGWQAVPVVTMLALGCGGVVLLPSLGQFSFFGGTNMLGSLVITIIVRELGPLLIAMVVTARSGTAVASELGNMRVNREIEALESVGINPLSFIVFPRIVGGVISTFCLGFYFDLVAIMGGFFLTKIFQNMSLTFYLDSLANAAAVEDFVLFALKNSFSGAIIFVISAYQGLLVRRSPHEVPQVTTKAVMNSIFYVLSFNLGVSIIFYVHQLMLMGVI